VSDGPNFGGGETLREARQIPCDRYEKEVTGQHSEAGNAGNAPGAWNHEIAKDGSKISFDPALF